MNIGKLVKNTLLTAALIATPTTLTIAEDTLSKNSNPQAYINTIEGLSAKKGVVDVNYEHIRPTTRMIVNGLKEGIIKRYTDYGSNENIESFCLRYQLPDNPEKEVCLVKKGNSVLYSSN